MFHKLKYLGLCKKLSCACLISRNSAFLPMKKDPSNRFYYIVKFKSKNDISRKAIVPEILIYSRRLKLLKEVVWRYYFHSCVSWTSSYMDPLASLSKETFLNLAPAHLPLYRMPLLVTSGGQDSTPVQTCSLKDTHPPRCWHLVELHV